MIHSNIIRYRNQFLDNFLAQTCFLCQANSQQAICSSCVADLPFMPTKVCPHCAKLVKNREICYECEQNPLPFNYSQAIFSYDYPIDILISRAKFQRNLVILNWLANMMASRLSILSSPDILIPVPLHPKRLCQRGYNQSLELAKYIMKQTKIPLADKACKRIKNTTPQTSLNNQQRQKNVLGIFEIIKIEPHWQHIVLIDDVMTTGSTVKELAIILKCAGVKQVDVWCCARTL